MAERIQIRRDTLANWASANPVLAVGEIGIETGPPVRLKIGDGSTLWNSLAYYTDPGSFLGLIDTPSSYSGQALRPVRVNAAANALEFFDPGATSPTVVHLTGNISSVSTSYADVTGLSFSVVAEKDYFYEFDIIYQSTATVCGIGFAINGPASPNAFVCQNSILTELNGTNTFQNWSANTYDGNGPSTSVIAANSNMYARARGFLRNGSNAGTLVLRFRSETGTSVSVRTGSFGRLYLLN